MSISKAILLSGILAAGLLLAACGGGEPPKANTNVNTGVNALNNAPKENVNSAVNKFGGVPQADTGKTNEAASIKPVVDAYYDALKKKDDAAFRKVYSAAGIKELESEAKSEGRKSIVDYLSASEPAGDKPFEVKNEKVEGDSAVAEIRGGVYENWTKWKFVKENGEWKLAPPSENLKLLGK
jgi:hypothetical protein